MLSSTAESLYWLARYNERAGNVARGLGVVLRMTGMAAGLGSEHAEMRALLVATGGEEAFGSKHDGVTQDRLVAWLVNDPDNPSSILASLEAARRNGRAVRTALTVDMWEALNDTWNRLRTIIPEPNDVTALTEFLSWVRERVLLFNGAAYDTMLREEAWHFVHLGTMLERADNTARLLDVKHHQLAGKPSAADTGPEPAAADPRLPPLPGLGAMSGMTQSMGGMTQSMGGMTQSLGDASGSRGGMAQTTGGMTQWQGMAEGAVDYMRWQAILRSVSALRAYQRIYRDRLEPRQIAELLILRPELPRSLHACMARVAETLDAIALTHGGRRGECHRLAGVLHSRLRYGRIEAIVGQGLHEFLTEMIDCNAVLGLEIERFYIADR